MLLLFCALYVMLAFGGGGERPIERSAEEGTGGDQMGRLAVDEGETGGGGAGRALMLGHRRRDLLDSASRPLFSRGTVCKFRLHHFTIKIVPLHDL